MAFKRPAFKHVLLALGLSVAPVLGAQAWAQTSIAVVVNDQAITNYDVNQRAKLIRLTQRKTGATAQRLAEQELIDDSIKLAEAKRIGVTVSESDVNNAFGSIASNVKLSPSKLSQALRQNGVSPDTLKDRLRAQLAWSQVVRRRFQASVDITDSEVIAALRKSDMKDQQTSIEYDLKRVVVVVPQKSSNGFRAQRKRESDAIRAKFSGCDTSGPILGTYKEVVIMPIGRRLETEIPENMRTAIDKAGEGKLTAAEKTGRGYEMIAVCGKREIKSDIAARTEMENVLREKEGEQLSRRYLMDLRRRATIVDR
ncbi:SurA N-terminal domain-containing protein [Roseibium limicola]|uniref:SurA N-terminal domain-containing protein n=1 Tax=Roseibium limicola TaxID=2816037 RepID=A0A939J7H3_9HYPH|nr:SurA N-terminal domain-containing protein [Roseibium limicola]MBO0346177.1 SurA N-terminal domain-containing protein [Roseibium limicola]